MHAYTLSYSLFFFLILFFFFSKFSIFPLYLSLLFSLLSLTQFHCTPLLLFPLCIAKAPFILPSVTRFLLFYPLTTFVLVWVSFPDQWVWVSFPDHSLVCQLSSHHHLPVLAMPHPIPKQRVLFWFLVHHGILIRIRMGILSYYPSWHAPNDSN